MTVTFFGHRDAPDVLEQILEETIEYLIVNECADTFYVGNHGNFDRIVSIALTRAQQKHPQVKCYIVISQMPTNQKGNYTLETLFPEEVAQSHYKDTVNKRNMWMLRQSDTVVTYVRCSFGGAANFRNIAIRHGKRIIDLHDSEER